MSTTTDHLIETVDSVSLAVAGRSAEGADMKSMPGVTERPTPGRHNQVLGSPGRTGQRF